MPENLINLARLPRELSKLTGTPAVPYRTLYHLVLAGRIPAESVSGRWYVAPADLPAIAQSLGLTADGEAA